MLGIHPKAALYTPLKLNDKIVGLVVVRTIHQNVYQPHHLYVLKTVGNFVVRALQLAGYPQRRLYREKEGQRNGAGTTRVSCQPDQKKRYNYLQNEKGKFFFYW